MAVIDNPCARHGDDTHLLNEPEDSKKKKDKGKAPHNPISQRIQAIGSTALQLIRPSLSNQKNDLTNLEKELLIPGTKLERISQTSSEALDKYVEDRRKKYASVLEISRKDYAKIEANYVFADDSRQSLMKIILMANRKLEEIKKNHEGISFIFKKYNTSILSVRDKEGRLQLISWSGVVDLSEESEEVVGIGAYGIAQEIKNITLCQDAVIKFARNNIDEGDTLEAKVNLQNEKTKLKLLNSQGPQPGIQYDSFANFKILSSIKQNNIIGFAQHRYSHRSIEYLIDHDRLNEITLIQKFDILLQICKALKWLHTPIEGVRGAIIHGDIKPGNIFLDEQNGSILGFLADFGGSKDIESELPIEKRNDNNLIQTVSTPGYFSKMDLINFFDANTQEEWGEALKKRDLFALGATFWEFLMGRQPYNVPVNKSTPNFNQGIQNLDDFLVLYGNTLGTFFINAMHEDPKKRPSIDEFIEVIEEKLKELKSAPKN